MQSRNSSNSQGMDISKYQGTMNWDEMKSNGAVKFVIMKASESAGGVDPSLQANYKGAKRVGIPLGFYHFAHLTNDPSVEAKHYLDTVSGLTPDLWHVLDIENRSLDNTAFTPAQVSNWAETWLYIVEKATGKIPMIYTGASFAREHLQQQLSRYPLWIAHYGAVTPMGNNVWDRWTVFQYSESGYYKGIGSQYVDLDEFDGNIETYLEKQKEDEPMTAAERQAFEQLQATVNKVTEEVPAPDWAKEAADYYAPHMAKPQVGTHDFWRGIVIQYRKDKGITV